MKRTAAFIPLIHGQLAELKKLVSGRSQLQEAIAETESYLQSLSSTDQIKLSRALKPFFISMASKRKSDVKVFLPIVLSCFYNVFSQSTIDLYPDRELTHEMINILISADSMASDGMNLQCCNLCIACLRSPSGIFHAHGKFLRRMFKLLFRIYNNTKNPNTFNSIKTSIQETLMALFSSYLTPPEVPQAETVKELSENVINGIIQNSEAIQECLGTVVGDGDYSVTIRDVDIYVVLSLLAKIIEQNRMELRTIHLAAEFLSKVLTLDSEFYSTNSFKYLLQTKIHVAAMALSLDSRTELVSVTSELIFVLWSKYANDYIESLNEVLVKGLATLLIAPDPNVVSRALMVYSQLAKHPQLFVDSFINYDCDESGFFPNVFANTMNQIVRLSYPDMKQTPVQRHALDVLVHILENLWIYFNSPFSAPSEQEEAPQAFLDAKKNKTVLEDGMKRFKENPKKGLAFFVEHGFVENSPEAIAKYLHENPSLDPAGVGEVIGGEKNIDILKEFVKLFDFKGLTFEQAFRAFLSSFQIPGESQMIGRVMEQFGEKYYNDNPDVFSCADTVYVLSYSALMLHTDAHHPNVKSRMTLQEFINNNRGIDGGKDLPKEFIEDLYNGIRAKRIFCSATASIPNSSLLTREQRADLFKVQAQEALSQARERSDTSHGNRQFHKHESPLFIGPMFQTIWGGVLATLTMTFEQSESEEIYTRCLTGLKTAVHIASHCFVEDALTTVVDAFTKFTALRWKRPHEIKEKNIACCSALLEVAKEDGNFLRNAWVMVLDQVSELDKLRSMQTQFNYDFETSEELFSNSGNLDHESISDFVAAMCEKSMFELHEKPRRQFMLEHIGIVSHSNIKREQFIWTKIWNHIGKHLRDVAATSDPDLAIVVVDILRQLASKFLKQEELTQFHFQENFMRPFSDIFANNQDKPVKDFVLICIQGIITEMASNLQSGWSVIFEILKLSSQLPETKTGGFEVTQELVDKYLDMVAPQMIHIVSILQSFITHAPDAIKIAAIGDFIAVADKSKLEDLAIWTTMFEALAQAAQNSNQEVRKKAQEVTHSIFNKVIEDGIANSFVGDFLQKRLPNYITGQPISDTAFYSQASSFIHSFFEPTLNKYYESRFSEFFEATLSAMSCMIHSPSAKLSSTGIATFGSFLKANLTHMDEAKLGQVLDMLRTSSGLIFTLSLDNEKAFVSLIFDLASLSGRRDSIDLLYLLDKQCEESQEEKNRYILWAFIRSNLLRALQIKSEEHRDLIIECMYHTFELFLELGFTNQTESTAGVAWNEETVAVLGQLNEMNKDMFTICFEKSAGLIVKMVTARSLDVRKQISQTLKKKLL